MLFRWLSRKPPKKTHEVVADKLRDRIFSGELTDGDRLPPRTS